MQKSQFCMLNSHVDLRKPQILAKHKYTIVVVTDKCNFNLVSGDAGAVGCKFWCRFMQIPAKNAEKIHFV